MFSLIVPTNNSEKYIKETIHSINSLGIRELEVFFVDNSSTDNTVKIIEKECKFKFLIISEPDEGMYNAINKGMKRSKGDVLSYINSDDLLNTGIIKAIEIVHDNKADVCFGSCIHFDERRSRRFSYPTLGPRVFGSMSFMPIAQPGTVFSRKVYEQLGGFDEVFKNYGDFDFFARAKLEGFSFHRLKAVTASFRNHPNQLTLVHWERCLRELEFLKEKLRINNKLNRYFLNIYGKICFYVVNWYQIFNRFC